MCSRTLYNIMAVIQNRHEQFDNNERLFFVSV